MDLVNILEYVRWNNEMITKFLCAWFMEMWNKVDKTLAYALKGVAYFIKASCKWIHGIFVIKVNVFESLNGYKYATTKPLTNQHPSN
jgi:hypothetical protein